MLKNKVFLSKMDTDNKSIGEDSERSSYAAIFIDSWNCTKNDSILYQH